MSESLTSVDLLAIMLRAEAGSDVPALLATIAQLLEAIEPFAHEGFSGLDTGNWIRNWEQVRAVYERLAPAHLHPFEGRASVVALQQMTERVPTTRPLPAIARVDLFEWNSSATTPSTLGTVRMTPDGHLECDPPGEDGLESLIEDLRYDYAFGREWRRLTDAELLAHLPLRPMGYTWAEAYDADGNPVDVSGITNW